VKSYGQYCPVAKAAEIVAERWTPLVLRELLTGSVRFNDLRRGLPLMSPSLLSRRLKELEQAGIVIRTRGDGRSASEYRLTPSGKELWPVIEQLGIWGKRWAIARIERNDLDAGLLMWAIRKSLRIESLPARRSVLKFELAGTRSGKRAWWLMVEAGEVELCLLDPGFEIDLRVRAHVRTVAQVLIGDRSWREALRSGDVVLEGSKRLAGIFPSLLVESPFAAVERAG
jgi:DNA-binding HxlR family transcriptional regulator